MFLAFLTSKCASGHNGAHFFAQPKLKCFNMFTSKCASPHNSVHFFHISTSKSAPNPWPYMFFQICFAHLSSGQMALHRADGSAPAALASLLFDPRPWEPQNIGKPVFRDFSTFFARLTLPSSDSFSPLIFFLLPFSSLTIPPSAASSVHTVGSLTSKLPLINRYDKWINNK